MAKDKPLWRKRWDLEGHHKKHPAGEHENCWNDLLRRSSPSCPISVDRYEDESERVIQDCWLEYTAKTADSDAAIQKGNPVYRYQRRHYVDARMLETVTGYSRKGENKIYTCFDIHFQGKYLKMTERPPLGQLQNEYKKRLENNIKGRQIEEKSFQVIVDESK